jgi:signal transduction histidine kinase
MLASITRSVRGKLMMVVLATTLSALFVAAVALSVYEIRIYDASLSTDLRTQAEIIGRASAPALAFDDPKAAEENLRLLRVRPTIRAAAIYGPDGAPFAHYAQAGETIPASAQADGHRIVGDRLVLFQPIDAEGNRLGTIYLSTRYELATRLADYFAILVAVMATSLLIATILSTWMQARVTKPILDVTAVAREVMERRDFSLRAEPTTEDEVGVLVDAFNDMLAEVGRRADALEAAYMTLQHEIAERRAAEAALRAADRRKDEFLATLAHELRNPLAPLRNGLQLLRMQPLEPGQTEQVQQLMERQVAQLVRLVDDLLDVSRITTGKLALRRENVELKGIVQNAVDTVQPLVRTRRHRLNVEMPPGRILLDGDPTRLAQVLSNLLNNAAKYTPPEGEIALRVTIDDNGAVVTITDNGIGIPADMLASIFDMFTQVDTALDRETAGLGVGLTLARRLVELHGGTIEASSQGKGCGSTFTVRLPAVYEPDAEDVAADAAALAVRGGRPLRVLLADDNVDFAQSLAMLLRSLGQQVLVTHDGKAALDAAPGYAPDIAFLDIGLPKLHGYALAQKLRELPATRTTKLVAITGWGQAQDRERAKQAGFDRHLVKPVGLEDIVDIIESMA